MAPSRFGVVRTDARPIEREIVGVQADAANAGPAVRASRSRRPFRAESVAKRASWRCGRRRRRRRRRRLPTSFELWIPRCRWRECETIQQTLRESTAADRFYTVFFAAFAGVALALASIGIYGVMSFAVAQRTHEIGLRMALGGNKRQVLARVLREGMTTALAGTAPGTIGAALIGRVLEGAVYGVETTNPFTFAAVAVTLLLAAFVACVVPARRAASVDPMVALRQG